MPSFTELKIELEEILSQIQKKDLPFEEIQKLYTRGIAVINLLEADLDKITIVNYISE